MRKKIVLFANKLSNEGGYKASANFFKLIKNDYNLNFYTRSVIKKNILNFFKVKTYYLFNSIIWKITSKFYNISVTIPAFDFEFTNNTYKKDLIIFQYANEIISNKFIMKNAKKKLYFFLHDEWLFNGIFHFKEKKHFKSNFFLNFLENFFLKKKIKTYSNLKNLNLVGNCEWITNKAKNSKIFKHANFTTMYNPIDTNFFKKNYSINYKEKFGFDVSKKYILYLVKGGTANFRKGGDLFANLLIQAPENLNFVCVSDTGYKNYTKNYKNLYILNNINDPKTLRDLYSACDLNLTLSRNECIPFSVIESMSCGIPNVSFDVGGIKEVIKHKQNGWVCKNKSIGSVLKGIEWIFSSTNIEKKLSSNSRKIIVNNFSNKIAKKKFRDIIK